MVDKYSCGRGEAGSLSQVVEELMGKYDSQTLSDARAYLDAWGVKYRAKPEFHDMVASETLPLLAGYLKDSKEGDIEADKKPSWLEDRYPDLSNLGEYVMFFMEDMYRITLSTTTNMAKAKGGIANLGEAELEKLAQGLSSILGGLSSGIENLTKTLEEEKKKLK